MLNYRSLRAVQESSFDHNLCRPLYNESVFWYEKERFENRFLGNHGGLTRPEMETIFLFQEGKRF